MPRMGKDVIMEGRWESTLQGTMLAVGGPTQDFEDFKVVQQRGLAAFGFTVAAGVFVLAVVMLRRRLGRRRQKPDAGGPKQGS